MAELTDLFLSYYDIEQERKPLQTEYEQLMDNPVTYKNQTDVEYLEKVLEYREELIETRKQLEGYNDDAQDLIDQIMDILDDVGVPAHTKIAVPYNTSANLFFWYDEQKYVHVNGPVVVTLRNGRTGTISSSGSL